MQWPARARHARLRPRRTPRRVICPARCSARQPPAVGAGAELLAAPLAAQHRAAGHHDGRDVGAGGAHQHGGRGLVAARTGARRRRADRRGCTPRRPSPSRLRNIMVVGFISTSPSEIVGNSSGKPPADQHAALDRLGHLRRCALQLVSSHHELAMPITGRPSNTTSLKPSALSHERWTNPSRSLTAEPVAAAQRSRCHGGLRDPEAYTESHSSPGTANDRAWGRGTICLDAHRVAPPRRV